MNFSPYTKYNFTSTWRNMVGCSSWIVDLAYLADPYRKGTARSIGHAKRKDYSARFAGLIVTENLVDIKSHRVS
jgi:hypothetical protein